MLRCFHVTCNQKIHKMDHNEDTEFGRYLLAQANSLETPLGKAADAYATGVIERITKAIANGDVDNTLQGDLELMKAGFLDAILPDPGQSQGGVFTKMDEDKHLVWGWANVSTMFGDTVVDKQNDTIDMDELQKAAHAFMSDRTSGQMHKYIGKDPHKIGEIVESMIFDNDLQKALGINLGREGWLIGVKVADEDTWQRIKKGELKAFSIGGKGVRKYNSNHDEFGRFSEGSSVKIGGASEMAGKTGKITEVSPSGKFFGVSVKGEHAGYFHGSDLKPAKGGFSSGDD